MISLFGGLELQLRQNCRLNGFQLILCYNMVATGQEMVREKNFFTVREKSVNFTSSQGKVKCLKEVREK